jgi:hypothetical protein
VGIRSDRKGDKLRSSLLVKPLFYMQFQFPLFLSILLIFVCSKIGFMMSF